MSVESEKEWGAAGAAVLGAGASSYMLCCCSVHSRNHPVFHSAALGHQFQEVVSQVLLVYPTTEP